MQFCQKIAQFFYPYALGMEVWLGLEWVRGDVDGLKLQ